MPRPGTLSASDLELLPTADDVQFYNEHGWYLSKKLLTDHETETLVRASDEYYDGIRDRPLPRRPSGLSYWTPDASQIQRNNDYIHYEDDEIGEILRKPLIGAVAATLAGVDLIRVFQATLLYKPPVRQEKSNIVPWHFDKYYWATSTSENMLTAFIPFHTCDESMGTITMVDGSHLWPSFRGWDSRNGYTAVPGDLEREHLLREAASANGTKVRKVPVTIPAGHMTFHHCRTYHGSSTNRSDRPRRSISLHLQDGENRYQDYAEADDSRQSDYKHDDLLRRDDSGRPDYADPEFCPVIWPAQ